MSFDDLKQKIKTMDAEAKRALIRSLGDNKIRHFAAEAVQ